MNSCVCFCSNFLALFILCFLLLERRADRFHHAVLVDTPELAGDSIVFLTRERRTWLAGRFLNVKWDLPELFAREKEIVDGDKLKMRMVM